MVEANRRAVLAVRLQIAVVRAVTDTLEQALAEGNSIDAAQEHLAEELTRLAQALLEMAASTKRPSR